MVQTERYKTKLCEQIQFLERSIKLYDEGHEDEAFRLSTTIRVLFHDTKNSDFLLKLMNLRGGKMLSSSRGLRGWKDSLTHEIALNRSPPDKDESDSERQVS